MIYTFRLERPAIHIISLALGARPHSEVARRAQPLGHEFPTR